MVTVHVCALLSPSSFAVVSSRVHLPDTDEPFGDLECVLHRTVEATVFQAVTPSGKRIPLSRAHSQNKRVC